MSLLTDPCRGSGDASAAFSTGLHDSTGEEGGESCVGVVTGVSCVPLGPAPLLARRKLFGPAKSSRRSKRHCAECQTL